MVGYFKNPEATKEVFTADGWFRTGDLGELDKDGWLYIKGRLKNMIVGPGGENIYPEDIETVLNSHVCIADSIVTEQEGRLIALVHFNREEIESMIDDLARGVGEQEGGLGGQDRTAEEGDHGFRQRQGQPFFSGSRRSSRRRRISSRPPRTRSSVSFTTRTRTARLRTSLPPENKQSPRSLRAGAFS